MHGDTTEGGQHRGGTTQPRGDDVGGGTMREGGRCTGTPQRGDNTEAGRHG